MRFQGKIMSWKDDQGFGFVMPNDGGEKAFVHIKAFTERTQRPVSGDLISYELSKDTKGRTTAINIRMINSKVVRTSPKDSVRIDFLLIILLMTILLISTYLHRLPLNVSVWYLTVSLLTFAFYFKDKLAARFDYWRTKENTLHFLSLIGGWPGAMLAQKYLRHKSTKKEFRFTFWLTVIINFIALAILYTSYDENLLSFR
jgi:uncharacterized membrane protein YsdA (DUF1294 family)/cold shock CspA family protein